MPSLPMFMLAAVLLGSPTPAQVSDPMDPYLSFLGVRLERTTLEQARAKLGGPRAVFNGGDAAAAACAQCYTGSDGTTLVLMSNEEMGGCSIITQYEVLQKEAMGAYSSLEGAYLAPTEKRPKCSRLKALSRSTLVGGRLKLGMTLAQVTKVMGKPSESSQNRIAYSSEVPMKMTKEEEARLKDRGPWDTLRIVMLEFVEGRVVAITVSQITSN